MIKEWNSAFKPYWDELDQYCEKFTIGECNQRKYELGMVKRIEEHRFEAMLKKRKHEKINHFTYDSC